MTITTFKPYVLGTGTLIIPEPFIVLPPTERPSEADFDSVHAQLNRLETFGSSDAIAEFFRRENVKGVLRSGRGCIVARWLTDTCGGPVRVGLSTAMSVPVASGQYASLPTVVRAFIWSFDTGTYPDLVL